MHSSSTWTYIQNGNHISKKNKGQDSVKILDIPVSWKIIFFALFLS